MSTSQYIGGPDFFDLQFSCSIRGCVRESLGTRNLCGMHYQREQAGLPMLTWKEEFLLDNPVTNLLGKIPLTKEMFALVDAADYPRLLLIQWQLHRFSGKSYARGRLPGSGPLVYLHRYIMGPPENTAVDHIDGNGLNCTRSNMRICTHAQNMRNIRSKRKGLKGVSYDKRYCSFYASIRVDRKKIHIGTFDTGEEAGRAYDHAARKVYGEFASYNYPPSTLEDLMDMLHITPTKSK
jgi:HNH endonuclease